jgi:hypothetical protein
MDFGVVNPRGAAMASERMSACIFADNLVSVARVEANGGTLSGSPAPALDRGATFNGSNSVTFTCGILPADPLTVVVRVSLTETPGAGGALLLATKDLRPGVAERGFCIWATPIGVAATVSDGTEIGLPLEVEVDLVDGQYHLITYWIGADGGHTLRVDALDPVADTVGDYTPGAAPVTEVYLGDDVIGIIKTPRIFGELLSAEDHLAGYVYAIEPDIEYRCQQFGHDPPNGLIWSRRSVTNDLMMGDGVTEATWPYFVSPGYDFDGVDDYVSGWPTLVGDYTVVAIVDTGSGPEMIISNDDSVEGVLTTPGGLDGLLYRLGVWHRVLTPMQVDQLRYDWLSKIPLPGVEGIDLRLRLEGATVLQHDYTRGDCIDLSGLDNDGVPTDVDFVDSGAEFGSPASVITVADDTPLRGQMITVAVKVRPYSIGPIFAKGGNYTLEQTGLGLMFNGVAFAGLPDDWLTAQHIVVAAMDGEKAILYLDGTEVALTESEVTLDDTDTDDLLIGGV